MFLVVEFISLVKLSLMKPNSLLQSFIPTPVPYYRKKSSCYLPIFIPRVIRTVLIKLFLTPLILWLSVMLQQAGTKTTLNMVKI